MDREHSLKTLLKNETPTITAHNQNLRLAGRLLRPVARTHPVSEMKKLTKHLSDITVEDSEISNQDLPACNWFYAALGGPVVFKGCS